MMFVKVSEEVNFQKRKGGGGGQDGVWPSHFYVSNQISPSGGSTPNKHPLETVFALKVSANTDREVLAGMTCWLHAFHSHAVCSSLATAVSSEHQTPHLSV